MAGHAHAHAHGHGDGHDEIGWAAFRTDRVLQAVLGFVLLVAVAAVVALVALWPSDSGQDEAIERGELVGIGSERYAATVVEVVEGPCSYSTSDQPQTCRRVTFEVDEGPFAGTREDFQEFNLEFDAIAPDVSVGDGVIAGYEPSTEAWFYADRDRRGSLVVLALLFAAVVIALGRWRGALALAGMVLTVAVLVWFVAPSVLDGNDPLLVAVVAAAVIAFVSLYLTHGVNATTTVALAGTLVSLALTLGLSWIFFEVAHFTGLAAEEALFLPFIAESIDLSSLLLGGAVLGTLGALDDVTVTQVATVAELHRRSPDLPGRDLVVSGIRVGKEHIASTVNTLLLAYVGASMPLLLLFAASDQPLDKVANAELLSVEIVRTLCGSIGLVAAVPITTALAALVVRPRNTRAETPSPMGSDPNIETDDPLGSDPCGKPVVDGDVGEGDEGEEPEVEVEPDRAPSWDDFAPEDRSDTW